MALRYHIGRDGQRYGPFSETELREQLARGDVLADDSIWHEGLPGWQPVASLFPDAPSAPPPPLFTSVAPPPVPVPGANTGFILGLVNLLLTWFIPIIGLPLSIWGLVASIKASRRGAGGKPSPASFSTAWPSSSLWPTPPSVPTSAPPASIRC